MWAGWYFIAVIIVLIIIVATLKPHWRHMKYMKSALTERPVDVYRRSAGGNDTAARLALQRIVTQQNPTMQDRAVEGLIISRNILGEEHRPSGITAAAIAHTNNRLRLFEIASEAFATTLTRPVEIRPGIHAGFNEGDYLPDEFIIDIAQMFAIDGTHDAPNFDPVMRVTGARPAVNVVLADLAQNRREKLVAARKEIAGGAPTPAGRADMYINLAKQETDDPQNSHDTGVLASLRAIVARLRAENYQLAPTTEIKRVIESHGVTLSENRPTVLADVLKVISRIEEGDRVISIGATDEECLQLVWARIHDPRNAADFMNLERALFDALYDCWHSGIGAREIVCVNGRASRILGALVLLDFDEKNWEVKKFEQFKNDIFDLTRNVIEAASRVAAAEGNVAARAYLATDVADLPQVSATDAEQYADFLRKKITTSIQEYIAGMDIQAMPAHMVEAVISEAVAAV